MVSLRLSLGIWPRSSLCAPQRKAWAFPAGFPGSYLAFGSQPCMCSISLVTQLLIWSLGIILCISQGKGLLLPHSPHSSWSGARMLMGALLMEKKGRRPCLMVIQLLMPFPQSSSGEVVLATFKIVFSLKITPTAPTPSPWILGSIHPTEICFLKLIFFCWLASCLFFEVVVWAGWGGIFPKHIIPLGTSAYWDFPDSSVIRTPHSQCRGHSFDPRSGN